VQGEDGKWRSIDARVMFALGVSASETYNTAIEDEISRRLGVRFASRSQAEVGKREVREIAGIDVRLNGRFSSRRSVIEQRFRDKMTTYRADHGHEAPKNVQRRLAQEATLESRPDKDDLRTLAAQRADWLAIARDVLGVKTDAQVEASVLGAVREAATVSSPVGVLDPTRLRVHDVLENDVYGFVGLISDYRRPEVAPVHSHADGTALPAPTSAQIAEVVLRSVQEENSTWTRWHLQAETERRLRRLADVTGPLSNGERSQRVQAITTLARAASIELTAPATETARPQQLIRADGESIYTVHGALRYSSTEILDAEDRLVRAARTTARAPISERAFEAALGLAAAESGRPIDVRQVALARSFATDKVLLQVGIGPAGTGKTTSMKLLVDAATMSGRRVIGLAPSAAAAAVLSGELGVKADTIHKLMHDHVNANPKAMQVQDGDIILVDEAGMAGTMRLDWLTKLAADNGAVVRLLGDPQQLAAVESGGALRLIEQEVGAVRLREVYRFRDPAEAAATLQVRDGKPEAVAFYTGAGRVAGGALDPMVDAIYTAWHADTQQGVSSLMVAARNDVVVQLSSRARVDRIAEGAVDDTRSLDLHDGNAASPGDHIVTRKNERTLQLHHGQDFVKNGDLWSVRDVHDDGSLTVQHRGHNGVVTLPADYAARHVELSYAATIHRVQGMTVDTSHTLVDSHTTRENLYVAGTRGRESNRFYTVTDPTVDVDGHHPPEEPRTPEQVLYAALAAVGAERSATETLRDELAQAQSLARLIPQYDDAFTRHANTVFDLRQIITDIASPALATAILDDTAWPHLARAVAVQAAGHDPASVLRSAIDDRELTTAESPAKVLAWRITGKGGYLELVAANAARGEGLPSWVSSPPAQTTTAAGEDVSELTTWLRQRGELISTRIDSLVDVAAVEQPAWWRALGPEPLEEQRAREHAGVARDVAAWRDQHGVSAEHGLGARPSTEGPDRRAYDALQQRVRSIAAQATSPSSPEPGGQAARVAQRQVTGQSYDTDSRPEQRREGPRL
ncbi:MAG: AAA family ATPase, partial [Janthinobacterium lividum]